MFYAILVFRLSDSESTSFLRLPFSFVVLPKWSRLPLSFASMASWERNPTTPWFRMAPVTPQGHCRVIASCLVLEGLAGCELERKMQVPSEAWEEVLGALMGGHFVCKGFLQYREWANRHLPMCYVLGVGKIPWRREWQPTSVCLPRKCRGQRSLVGYNPWDHKESDMSEHTHARAHTHTHTHTSWGLFFFPIFLLSFTAQVY